MVRCIPGEPAGALSKPKQCSSGWLLGPRRHHFGVWLSFLEMGREEWGDGASLRSVKAQEYPGSPGLSVQEIKV